MKVRVLLFAAMADAAGVRECDLPLSCPATVGDALASLWARYPHLEPLSKGAVAAVNERYVRADASLSEGDVLAIIPPVSGG